jgi:hypothetical protein
MPPPPQTTRGPTQRQGRASPSPMQVLPIGSATAATKPDCRTACQRMACGKHGHV